MYVVLPFLWFSLKILKFHKDLEVKTCACVGATLTIDTIVLNIVERDTWEILLVHCLRYCYSYFTLVTILSNELVIFPGITFYYGNNYIVILQYLIIQIRYIV